MKIDIAKTDSSDVVDADWEKVSTVNNLMHSLFKQIDLEIDGKSISHSPQTYAYKAYFETLLGFTKDAKESHLSSVGYFNDADHDKSTLSKLHTKLIKPETVDKIGTGKSVEFMGKLHFDLAFQPKALLGGVKLKITLVPNDAAFYVMTQSGANIKPKVEFEDIALYVHRSKVNLAVVDAHNTALAKGNARYTICRNHVKSFTINKDTIEQTIDNAIVGQLPRRLFITFVPNSAFAGTLTKDPFNFKHYNINYLTTSIDGVQYPTKPYSPNFVKGYYVREYLSLFEALNQITTDSVIALTKSQWAKGNTIFAFNYSPDLSEDCTKQGYANLIRQGALRLHMKFDEALNETINVLLFCEFDNMIEIDINRNVYTDYM